MSGQPAARDTQSQPVSHDAASRCARWSEPTRRLAAEAAHPPTHPPTHPPARPPTHQCHCCADAHKGGKAAPAALRRRLLAGQACAGRRGLQQEGIPAVAVAGAAAAAGAAIQGSTRHSEASRGHTPGSSPLLPSSTSIRGMHHRCVATAAAADHCTPRPSLAKAWQPRGYCRHPAHLKAVSFRRSSSPLCAKCPPTRFVFKSTRLPALVFSSRTCTPCPEPTRGSTQ